MWESFTGRSPAAHQPWRSWQLNHTFKSPPFVFFLDILLFVLIMIMSLKTVSGTVLVFDKCELNTHKHTQVNTQKTPAAAAWHYRRETGDIRRLNVPSGKRITFILCPTLETSPGCTHDSHFSSIHPYLYTVAPLTLKSFSWCFTETQREERRGEERR